jgi:hypothetical protein
MKEFAQERDPRTFKRLGAMAGAKGSNHHNHHTPSFTDTDFDLDGDALSMPDPGAASTDIVKEYGAAEFRKTEFTEHGLTLKWITSVDGEEGPEYLFHMHPVSGDGSGFMVDSYPVGNDARAAKNLCHSKLSSFGCGEEDFADAVTEARYLSGLGLEVRKYEDPKLELFQEVVDDLLHDVPLWAHDEFLAGLGALGHLYHSPDELRAVAFTMHELVASHLRDSFGASKFWGQAIPMLAPACRSVDDLKVLGTIAILDRVLTPPTLAA